MTTYAKLSPKVPFELLRDLIWAPAYELGAMYYYCDLINVSLNCCYIVKDITPEDELVLRLSGYLSAIRISVAFLHKDLVKELK